MNIEIFKKHKFQYISFCHVYHKLGRPTPVCINADSHLMHITRGTGSVTIDGKDNFTLERGQVLFIPRKTIFKMFINPDFEMLNLHYQIFLENDQYMDDKLSLPYVFSPEYFADCEEKLRKMIVLRKEETVSNILESASLAYDIVRHHLLSCELLGTHRHAVADKIDQVAEYLKSNDCAAYDSEELSEMAGLSKSQLNRRFKQVFGVPPHKYWEQALLRKVCIRIEQTEKSFTDIAKEFSFSSPYYFSRWFKKIAGCPPSRFRKNPPVY